MLCTTENLLAPSHKYNRPHSTFMTLIMELAYTQKVFPSHLYLSPLYLSFINRLNLYIYLVIFFLFNQNHIPLLQTPILLQLLPCGLVPLLPNDCFKCYFSYFYLFFCLFAFSRATPVAYGGSRARGLIRAAAVSLCQSHSNAGSKLCL